MNVGARDLLLQSRNSLIDNHNKLIDCSQYRSFVICILKTDMADMAERDIQKILITSLAKHPYKIVLFFRFINVTNQMIKFTSQKDFEFYMVKLIIIM